MSCEENLENLSESDATSNHTSEFEIVMGHDDDTTSEISNEFDMDYYMSTESETDDDSTANEEEQSENKKIEGISFYFYAFENITYTKTNHGEYHKKLEKKEFQGNTKVEKKSPPAAVINVPYIRKPVFSKFVEDKNPIVDGFLCSHDKYNNYAQKVSSGLEALLFSCEQISTLYEHNHLIRRKMGNTLKIVATPGLVKNLNNSMDPLILYSLVGCLPKGEIIFPVADNIIRHKMSSFIECFLDEIKIHCLDHQRAWPFCQRFITDVDFEVISAVLNHFNRLNILTYLQLCYTMHFNKRGQVRSTMVLPKNFVCLQFSASNCSKVMFHEVKRLVGVKRTKLVEFIISSLRIVFNLFKMSHCIIWFHRICIVLLSPYWSKRVQDCFNVLTNHPRRMPTMNNINASATVSTESLDKLRISCKRSPFKDQFLKYYLHCRMICIKDTMEESSSLMATKNVYYCPKVVKMIMDNCVAMLPFWSNIVGIQIEPNQFHTEQDVLIENFYNEIRNEHLGDKRLELGQFIRGYGDFVQLQIDDLRNYY